MGEVPQGVIGVETREVAVGALGRGRREIQLRWRLCGSCPALHRDYVARMPSPSRIWLMGLPSYRAWTECLPCHRYMPPPAVRARVRGRRAWGRMKHEGRV